VQRMKGFSERNPITIAVAGLVGLAAIGLGVFYSNQIIGTGTTYSADFTDAGGLRAGNDVRIAGIKVGTIDSISLHGTKVRIEFDVKDAWVGNQTMAAIKIKTLLGQEYIALDPQGDAAQDAGSTIPTSRTTTPIDVVSALAGLSDTAGNIDTAQLSRSFEVLSDAFRDTPKSVHATLTGLSDLSRVISSRDVKLRQLAQNTRQVTSTLVQSNEQFATLINDGALLLQELQARSSAVTSLLNGTKQLATQLTVLVNSNQKAIGPALQQLNKVATILVANKDNIDNALQLIGPYYSLLNDAAGNGRWLDAYICGLFDSNDDPILSTTVVRDCAPGGGSG
jgi:phospholipid/cholesterol/gamma-HCH transport system substrate-binding protein